MLGTMLNVQITLFNSQSNFLRLVVIQSSFCNWGNQDPEEFRIVPQVTDLGCGEAEVWIPAVWPQKHNLQPL